MHIYIYICTYTYYLHLFTYYQIHFLWHVKIWCTVYFFSYMTMHPRFYRCIAPTSTSKVKLRFCVLTFQWVAQNGWAKLIGTHGSMLLGVTFFRFLLILRNPRNLVDTVWRCLEIYFRNHEQKLPWLLVSWVEAKEIELLLQRLWDGSSHSRQVIFRVWGLNFRVRKLSLPVIFLHILSIIL